MELQVLARPAAPGESTKKQMQRTSAAVLTAIIVASATGAVIAQTDPIATRQLLMKENNNNAIAIVRMMRGLASFDAAKIDAAFAQGRTRRKNCQAFSPIRRRPARKRARHQRSG